MKLHQVGSVQPIEVGGEESAFDGFGAPRVYQGRHGLRHNTPARRALAMSINSAMIRPTIRWEEEE